MYHTLTKMETQIDKSINSKANTMFMKRKIRQLILKQHLIFKEAIEIYKQVFEIRKKRDPSNVNISNPIYNLANCYTQIYKLFKKKKDIEEAETQMKKAIMLRKGLGDKDSILLSRMNGNLGEIYNLQDKIEYSIILFKEKFIKHIEE